MSDQTFKQLDALKQSEGAAAIIDKLIDTLRTEREFHKLFDALLLKKRHQMGLPLTRPTSFDDVPQDKLPEFEQSYIDSAREVGEALLKEGKIPQAWIYFRTIREPEQVAQAIDAVEVPREPGEEIDELLNVALYEGANPVKGLEIMLATNGTCNTITTLDQVMPQLAPADRTRAACLLVRNLYDDLTRTVGHEVEQRMAMLPPGAGLRELIAGRDWLFADGNYHIDVSHLHSVVRFARSLETGDSDLQKAIELAEYGSKLSDQFQYGGDPPFEEFYPAHVEYFKILADKNRDDALGYFREKLDAEPDEEDKQMIAYVLVDLLVRIGRLDEALDVAEQHLSRIEDPNTFSFAALCQQAGRMDVLQKVAREKGDLVSYTAALVQG
jgi:tetratricopeptide (TPR) repeat protein